MGLAKGCAFVPAADQVLVEAPHEDGRVDAQAIPPLRGEPIQPVHSERPACCRVSSGHRPGLQTLPQETHGRFPIRSRPLVREAAQRFSRPFRVNWTVSSSSKDLLTSLPQPSNLYLSERDMSKSKSEVPYGTLDLLILKTLETMGTMHGYLIARRIEQVSQEALKLSQGSIYPALVRLEQEGWITTEWGVSETNRKVKFYTLTPSGRRQIGLEVKKWEQANALVTRFLEVEP